MKYISILLLAMAVLSGLSCSRSIDSRDCGNGIRDWGEECDDGNRLGGDGCSFICKKEGQGPVDTALDSDGDTGTSTAEGTDSDTECEDGDSRCLNDIVQRCQDGVFENWTNCTVQGLVCRVVGGAAECVRDESTDEDSESETEGTETTTEIDTDSDTSSLEVCFPDDCGGRSRLGDCWCDESCKKEGDCCDNVCDACGDLDFCGTDTDTESDTGQDTESDTGQDTDTEIDTGQDTDTEIDTGQDTGTEVDTGQDTDTEIDTGQDTDTEIDTGQDTDTEIDTGQDTDTEIDTGQDTDTEIDTGQDTETEEETDTGIDTDTVPHCVVDVVLGALPLSGNVSEVLNIAKAKNDQEDGDCGNGRDMVVSFETVGDSDLSLSIVQIGDHKFGLYRDVGGFCTAKLVECYDPQGASSATHIVPNLQPGRYFLVVQGRRRKDAGTAVVTLSQIAQICGNNILDPGEECDDGNLLPGDGCNPICEIEPGECLLDEDLGVITPGEQIQQTLNVAESSDEWATECSPGGNDIAVRFTTSRPGDLHLQYSQSGNHGIGLYRDGNVETFLCLAENGVCLGEGPDQPGYVIFSNLTAGSYFIVAESVGFDAAGMIDLQLRLAGCIPNRELGLLRAGDAVALSGDISFGQNVYEAGCAGESGRERIVSFSLEARQTVSIKFDQTGDHVFGLYEELGGDCDANMVDCHDPGGEASGEARFTRVGPGNFLLIVDAYDPGLEGVVKGTISIY